MEALPLPDQCADGHLVIRTCFIDDKAWEAMQQVLLEQSTTMFFLSRSSDNGASLAMVLAAARKAGHTFVFIADTTAQQASKLNEVATIMVQTANGRCFRIQDGETLDLLVDDLLVDEEDEPCNDLEPDVDESLKVLASPADIIQQSALNDISSTGKDRAIEAVPLRQSRSISASASSTPEIVRQPFDRRTSRCH